MSAGINQCRDPSSLESPGHHQEGNCQGLWPRLGGPLGWEDPLTGRMPGLGSCEKTRTKREWRERLNDNHCSGKFILPLWGMLRQGRTDLSSHPDSSWGGPRPGIVTVALETLSN